MKVYKTTVKAKLLLSLVAFIFVSTAILGLFFNQEGPWQSKIFLYFWIVAAPLSILSIFSIKIVCDEDTLQMIGNQLFFSTIQTIRWEEIERIDGGYIINPKFVRLTLVAPNTVIFAAKKVSKEFIEIPIMFFPAELLEEILSRTPVSAKANLDEKLKNNFVREYGEVVVRKFDNMKSGNNLVDKNNFFNWSFYKRASIVYISALAMLTCFLYLSGQQVRNLETLAVLLLAAVCLSLVYFIFWRFLGGGK